MKAWHALTFCGASICLSMGTVLSLHAQELSVVEGTSAANSTVHSAASTSHREETWFTVPDAQLEQMRGGFDLGGGLVVSLGISMVTYINGQLATETAIAQTQLNRLSSDQASQLRERLSSLTVVQNGPGNRWGNYQSPSDGSSTVHQVIGAGPGTVIQNSLDNQHIQQLTVIDAHTNALGLMRASSWHNTLRESLGSVVGGVR